VGPDGRFGLVAGERLGRAKPGLSEPVVDAGQQFLTGERLDDVIVGAGLEPFGSSFFHCPR
jgi:hypothetical protein